MKIFGLVILTEKEYCKTREGLTLSLCSEFGREKEELKRTHDFAVGQLKNEVYDTLNEAARARNMYDRENRKLSDTIREQRKTIEALSEIEAKYKKLIDRDRDGKGRFVKRAGV